MGQPTKRDLRKVGEGFVALTWTVLRSRAYLELKPSTGKALPFFLGKVYGAFNDPQRYCTSFSFSYTEADRYGFAIATFCRVIHDLIDKGFIDPVKKGGLRGDGKSYSLYQLSHRWKKYGTAEFVQITWNDIK
jgi:hypothetical protein